MNNQMTSHITVDPTHELRLRVRQLRAALAYYGFQKQELAESSGYAIGSISFILNESPERMTAVAVKQLENTFLGMLTAKRGEEIALKRVSFVVDIHLNKL